MTEFPLIVSCACVIDIEEIQFGMILFERNSLLWSMVTMYSSYTHSMPVFAAKSSKVTKMLSLIVQFVR